MGMLAPAHGVAARLEAIAIAARPARVRGSSTTIRRGHPFACVHREERSRSGAAQAQGGEGRTAGTLGHGDVHRAYVPAGVPVVNGLKRKE